MVVVETLAPLRSPQFRYCVNDAAAFVAPQARKQSLLLTYQRDVASFW